MFKASVIFGVVVSFMILVPQAHSPQAREVQAAGGGQRGGGAGGAAGGAQAGRIGTIEERTTGMQKIDGYFPLYWDERTGIDVPRNSDGFDSDFLLSTGLAAGLGSNDIGLDRGQGGQGRVVSFQRVGPKVLLVQGNESFRSTSPNPAERKSVEDSFAKSILWGFTVGGRKQRARARRRDRFPAARRPRRGQRAASRHLSRRSHAQRVLHAAHEGVSRRTPRSK